MKRTRTSVLCIFSLVVFLLLSVSCELFSPEAPKGKLHIIVYGNNYKNNGPVTIGSTVFYASKLFGTVNDAVQVGNALCALAVRTGIDYDVTYVLSNDNVKGKAPTEAPILGMPDPSLISNDTSLSGLQAVISSVALNSNPEDTTVFFYSGHGWITEGKGALVPYGTDVQSKTGFVVGANDGSPMDMYYHDDFIEDISAIKGITVVLCDSCHSGGLVKPGYVSVDRDEYSGMTESKLFGFGDSIGESSSLFFLSASRYYEESFEISKRWHGYFTKSLLDALGWYEGDGVSVIPFLREPACLDGNMVTFSAIARYIMKNDGESRQHPSMNGGSNDVILFCF